jgi:hypothetical protein
MTLWTVRGWSNPQVPARITCQELDFLPLYRSSPLRNERNVPIPGAAIFLKTRDISIQFSAARSTSSYPICLARILDGAEKRYYNGIQRNSKVAPFGTFYSQNINSVINALLPNASTIFLCSPPYNRTRL